MIKKLLFGLLFVSSVSYAHDPSSSVEENVKWHMEQTLAPAMIESMKNIILQADTLDNLGFDGTKEEETLITNLLVDFLSDWINNNIHEITRIYRLYFTDEEIQSIVIFYQTPLGQKLLSTGSPMALDIMRVLQPTVIEYLMDLPSQLAQMELITPTE